MSLELTNLVETQTRFISSDPRLTVRGDGDVPDLPPHAARRGALPDVALGPPRPDGLRGLRAGRAQSRRSARRRWVRARAGGRAQPARSARRLGVVPKHVVQSRGGRLVAEAAVWSSVVVVVDPGRQRG